MISWCRQARAPTPRKQRRSTARVTDTMSAVPAALARSEETTSEQFSRLMIERRVVEAVTRGPPENKTGTSIGPIVSWTHSDRLWPLALTVIAALFVLTVASCASLG